MWKVKGKVVGGGPPIFDKLKVVGGGPPIFDALVEDDWFPPGRTTGMLGTPAVEIQSFGLSEDAKTSARKRGRRGGRGGKGRPKRQHSELIRVARRAILSRGVAATPALVRRLLGDERRFELLARELGDPVRDIIRTQVAGEILRFEYTDRWVRKRKGRKRFVELDDDALAAALKRAEKAENK